MTQPQPLTVSAICARTGASSDTVLAWIRSGDLPARNVATRTGPGNRPTYAVEVADFEAFWEARRVVAVAKRPRRRARPTVRRYV